MNFFVQMFGICIGYFVIRNFQRQFFIPSSIMTKIVSGFFFVQWITFHFSTKILSIIVLNVVYVGGILIALFIFHKRREIQFQRGFPDILTAMILQMKIGKSFRVSFQNALTTLPEYQRETLRKIQQNVAFLPQMTDKKMTRDRSFRAFLLQEFLKIDQSQHKTIEKLENFRGRLIIANNFRRRSGRIRENIYVQVGIMGFFYVAAFVYVITTMNFAAVRDVILMSMTLFVLGLLGAIALGRKIKWTL